MPRYASPEEINPLEMVANGLWKATNRHLEVRYFSERTEAAIWLVTSECDGHA